MSRIRQLRPWVAILRYSSRRIILDWLGLQLGTWRRRLLRVARWLRLHVLRERRAIRMGRAVMIWLRLWCLLESLWWC